MGSILTMAIRASGQTSNTITLNPSVRYQTITGWEGAFLQTISDYTNVLPAFNNLLTQAVHDLGINRVRLEIGSGSEHTVNAGTQYANGTMSEATYVDNYAMTPVNDNSNPFVINPSGFNNFGVLDWTIDNFILKLRQELATRGEQLYINLNYVDFDSSPFEHYQNPEEYAEFMLATFQHMQTKYGFVPNAIEVILEPDLASGWTATRVGQVIAATGARLATAGYRPDFIAPSTTSMGNAVTYFDTLMSVPNASQYVKEISYHRYSGVSIANLQAIASRAAQYGIGASMLEYWAGNISYNTLHEDLKIGRNSAWQQSIFGDVFNPSHALYSINSSNFQSTLTNISKFTRQYYKYVRAGAQRIDATTGNSNFDPLTFVNNNGTYVVVVKASTGGSFSISNLPAGTYGIFYTTSAQYDVNLADVTLSTGATLNTSIPASGIITIYGKSAPLDTTPPSAPVGFTATAISSSQINLSWIASTDNVGVTGYKIYRCQGTACAPTAQIATSATNSYSNTGLTASTAYTYAVSAYDAAGNNSGQLVNASATTQAIADTTPPTPPENLQVQ